MIDSIYILTAIASASASSSLPDPSGQQSLPASPSTSTVTSTPTTWYDRLRGRKSIKGSVTLHIKEEDLKSTDQKVSATNQFIVNDEDYEVLIKINSSTRPFFGYYFGVLLKGEHKEPPYHPYINCFYWSIDNPKNSRKPLKSGSMRHFLEYEEYLGDERSVRWGKIKSKPKKYLNDKNNLVVHFEVVYTEEKEKSDDDKSSK